MVKGRRKGERERGALKQRLVVWEREGNSTGCKVASGRSTSSCAFVIRKVRVAGSWEADQAEGFWEKASRWHNHHTTSGSADRRLHTQPVNHQGRTEISCTVDTHLWAVVAQRLYEGVERQHVEGGVHDEHQVQEQQQDGRPQGDAGPRAGRLVALRRGHRLARWLKTL